MAIGMIPIHSDPNPVMREYECGYPGCDYTEWAWLAMACPRHRRKLTAVKDGK